MTRLGVRLADIPLTYGWDALVVFVRHLPLDSATRRHLNADEAAFASDVGRAALLADVFDAIRAFNHSFAERGSRRPEPHPRPWDHEDTETFGRGAIPADEFEAWWDSH